MNGITDAYKQATEYQNRHNNIKTDIEKKYGYINVITDI